MVPANVQWVDSEIEIYDNETISITSFGEWRYDPRPNFKTGPDGIVKGSISKGSLLMKCNDEIFLVGSKWEGTIKENCVLYFGIYDDLTYADNVGQMTVRIDMDRESVYEPEDEDLIEENINVNETISETENVEEDNFFEDQICGFFAFVLLFLMGVLYAFEKK